MERDYLILNIESTVCDNTIIIICKYWSISIKVRPVTEENIHWVYFREKYYAYIKVENA